MPTVEINVLVLAGLVAVPCLLAWILQVSRINSLKTKILDHEYEMVKTHAYVLELEKENGRLKKDTRSAGQTADVIDISEKGNKTATA
jgi:hypothetical protein